MNRSILIILCDFLLLSLLTFSTDLTKIAGGNEQSSTASSKVNLPAKQIDNSAKDLAAAMKLALTEEQKTRNQLQAELAQTRATAEKQQAMLSERNQQAQQLQQQQAGLQQQFAAAQSNIKNLNQQLQNTSAEASQSKEQLAATQAEVQKQSAQAAALQQQLAQLAKNNETVLIEKRQLTNQLQLAEVEKRAAADQVALMQQQVRAERDQNARLAESFKTLATNSSALTEEIRENLALAPNAIFSAFVTNRVQTSFIASRTGIFGMDGGKNATAETVLVTDGVNTFALCHVQDTPISLSDPGTDWDRFEGTLSRNTAQVPIHSLSFDRQDPRVVFMPVTPAEIRQLGCQVYRISADPYKFQDAVLVGAKEGYYGQCNFQMDLDSPQYVKLDRSLLKGLFGKFNPSRGDLVFSRSGDLLGIMVNGAYCLVLHDFKPMATFQFGQDLRAKHTGETLAQLFDFVYQLPLALR
ncbi:MAG: hypothetical protein ACREFE_07190 [Limisphaerales bacterium]